MKRILFGNAIMSFAVLTLAYVVAAVVVPKDALLVVLTGASIGASALVVVVYTPLFWQSTIKLHNRVGILAIGMGMLFMSLIGRNVLSGFYRIIGHPEALPGHWLVGYLTLLACVGMALHVIAPGYPEEGFGRPIGGRYRWFVIGAIVAGAFLSLLLWKQGVKL